MSRKATGLARPYPVPVNLSADEDELLARDAHESQMSKTELLRRAYFRRGSEERLQALREKHKALPLEMFRRPPR